MYIKQFEETISGLRYFGDQRNKELFGTNAKHGPIFQTFKSIGEILLANNLTKVADASETKIDVSVVNTPAD